MVMGTKFICKKCNKEIISNLPRSIKLKKCKPCREKEQRRTLLANE